MKKLYALNGLVLMMMFLTTLTYGQTENERKTITSRYNTAVINQLERSFNANALKEKQAALQAARTNNWPVIIEENGTYAELQKLAPDGSPIYYTTFNVDAARSTRTNHLNIGGSLGLSLDGQNMTAHVWDGGLARPSHQEYDGPGGNNRFSFGDNSTTLNFHAAHVTGTIIASGVQPAAKGMAPRAQALGYDWNSDLSEATNAANNGMLISNHSYGYRSDLLPDYYFGAYITDSRDWDNLMYNAPYYLMVVSAGNDGNTNYNGSPLGGNSAYDKLTGNATSKNNMVVANAQDANVDASGNLVSVFINSSSSEGPTDDLRIKPDITGNGTGVYSTYASSDTAYNSISGTSMSSPNVAGSLLLLQQHHNNLNGSFMRAATLKGLALHTADDAGPTGPDPVFGWGLLNAKRAAEALSANGNESQINELTLASGQTYQITVDSDGINDLMASISWTDPAGTATTATNSTTPRLVNDLDIRVTQGGTTYSPWRLTGVTTNGKGDNSADPFERVEVANASGTYTITVTHKGSLSGGSQNYSLIITGLSSTPVVCNATTPANVSVDAFADTTATISWDPVPGASYTLRYRETGTTTWTTTTPGTSSANLSGLSPETTYEVQVQSECPDNSTSSYSSSVNFTTTEIQLNYCDAASTNVNDEYISRVQLNTIDNSSGAQFYSNFTNISTTLTQGQTYSITVTPTWTGTVYQEGYAVWIDYNKDGDFADAGEQVWTQSATTATPVSGSFTIPSGTVIGNTRMRVTMQYNAIPSPCGNFTYGEVEDYTVNLQGSAPDTVKPVITLNGASPVNVEQGNSYSDAGATASDDVDGNITSDIVVGGDTVNTNVVGTYVITYNVSDAAGNAADEVTRTVNVTPDVTVPVITLVGSPTVDVNLGETYNDAGATATDSFDGDITSDIVTVNPVNTAVAGTYVVTYNVSDAAGNAADEVSRTVNVLADTTPPVITLIGSPTVDVNIGNTYTDDGATAVDNVDGDLTSSIVTVNPVDTSVAGTYIVTYNVSDAAGNAASEVTRTVNVTNPPPPPPAGCAGAIPVPYSEGFENTIGAWMQSSADDLNWTVDANGTPSSSTGPSSAIQGSYYIYVEASGNGTGYPNKRAIITSPCFDLSGLTNPKFDFNYHMYGSSNMGTIDVEASTDNGSTWTSIWNESGNKGNQWNFASLDLSAYAGGSVQLRFNRLVGSTWQADIAIDNVQLSEDDGGGSAGCTTFDLNRTYFPFSNQDNGTSQLQNGNTELVLQNNAWKYVNLNYTITPNTVIQFEFGSTIEGEIHGLGFESDNNLSSNLVFKVHGTQNWGIRDFDNYPNNSQWVSYSINVGSYYTGTTDRLLFVADHDGGSRNGNSFYRNVVIFEDANSNGICDGAEFAVQTILADNVSPIPGNSASEGLDVVIYPNPVRGNILNVRLDGNMDDPTFKISNMLGQVVKEGRLNNRQIQVNELQSGVYFLQLSDESQSVTKRFIVE